MEDDTLTDQEEETPIVQLPQQHVTNPEFGPPQHRVNDLGAVLAGEGTTRMKLLNLLNTNFRG